MEDQVSVVRKDFGAAGRIDLLIPDPLCPRDRFKSSQPILPAGGSVYPTVARRTLFMATLPLNCDPDYCNIRRD